MTLVYTKIKVSKIPLFSQSFIKGACRTSQCNKIPVVKRKRNFFKNTFFSSTIIRNSHPKVFLGKGVLKICKATLLKAHFGMGVLL